MESGGVDPLKMPRNNEVPDYRLLQELLGSRNCTEAAGGPPALSFNSTIVEVVGEDDSFYAHQLLLIGGSLLLFLKLVVMVSPWIYR